jgi:dTMP kinase
VKKKQAFIVFEGIDGSGTSTQASLLVKFMNQNNIKTVLTCEPSEGPVGSLIKQAMKHRIKIASDPVMFDHQLAYLFAADRHDHLHNEQDGVFQFLNNEISVVSTRYFFSSYAYHCTSEDDFKLVNDLNSRFPNPDLVIYMDQNVDISLSRILERKYIEAYENKSKLEIVSSNYCKIFKSYKGTFLRVDATKNIDQIHSDITSFVRQFYGMP